MTPQEKVAKLEGLLARVKERAEAPRPHGAASPAKPAPAASLDAPRAPAVAPARPVPAAPAPIAAPPPVAAPPTAPPPEPSEPFVTATAYPADDSEIDVEVSTEVVEVDIDDEEGLMPAESGAQLVAEPAAELEEVHDDDGVPAAEVSVSEVTLSDEEELLESTTQPPATEPGARPANELVEPAPSSSPRPITADAPEPYAAESAPRHTPPPESGKVAAPSIKPEEGLPSLPPDSEVEEGHTLIGGWREPGVPIVRSPAVEPQRTPAVRVPAPPTPIEPAPVTAVLVSSPPAAAMPTTPVAARPRAEPIEPAVTKAQLPEAQVAVIQGAAPTFEPATFGDLLEATLKL